MLKNFKINKQGVSELMKPTQMQSILSEKAKAIAGRCGSGYEIDIYIGKTRANASVGPKTRQAKRDNYKNNTLLKAIR